MRQERNPAVDILASKHYGTLDVGVTSDPLGRMWQHRNEANPEWRDLAVGLGLPPLAPVVRHDGP